LGSPEAAKKKLNKVFDSLLLKLQVVYGMNYWFMLSYLGIKLGYRYPSVTKTKIITWRKKHLVHT
jgi:hypothetical protein